MPAHRALAAAVVLILPAVVFSASIARSRPSLSVHAHPQFVEPVRLASRDGVLEVTLTAHQGIAHLNTVAKPVRNALLFAYKVERGTASNGRMADDNLYPGPTLRVYPGQTLIVHVNNALTGLSIRDLYNPAYTPVGGKVPLYPQQMTSSPLNLHVHGVHVTPKGNGDNVLLDIQAGMSNTYVYRIPANMPQGAYWYHSHLHTLTTSQTYLGLAGLLEIGRPDGNLPLVTANHIPIRNFVLQYNDVFDRSGGLASLINPHWPEFVSTLVPPRAQQLADGTYRPSLAPVNFLESSKGTHYVTVWYAGPLSIDNMRGVFEFVPSNLLSFAPAQRGATVVNADTSLPDAQRDIQFTVNGQFQPTIRSRPGQTEIWILENLSDVAYINVQLTETATGRHPKIAIVGQDGNPFPAVHYPVRKGGRTLLIPPASRYAIAVTMPLRGSLVLGMPPIGPAAKARTAPAVLYTNDGRGHAPAQLGNVTMLPSSMSYMDGFFIFPTQTLATAVVSGPRGRTTSFVPGQRLHAYTSFVDLSRVKPDVTRKILINGGFLNTHASLQDPKAFIYAFDGNAFPNTPLIQPRLNSVEEWDFSNTNNDEHPIHVHVNDFQVTRYEDPSSGLSTGAEMWGSDNANVPAPKLGPREAVIAPGFLSMRTKFTDYIGLYVMHCHRLNHEDNGLMAMINVIPAISSYAVAVHGSPGHPAAIKVYDGNGDRLIATVKPFPNFYGMPSVAMGDVEDKGVLDLVAGTGKGASPQVAVYSGIARGRKGAFQTEVARFAPFASNNRGGVSVASAEIDGGSADNIIVGSGAGMQDRINVYAFAAPLGTAPKLFTSFVPFAGDRTGVSVAAGMVDMMSGRYSIVAAPGPGSPGVVKVFRLWLMRPVPGVPSGVDAMHMHQDSQGPVTTASFAPFGTSYRGGLSLAVGWIAGSLGGAQSIIAGELGGTGNVAVYSSGNALGGLPTVYMRDPQDHDYGVGFHAIARLRPFASAVRVATTATTTGADLLVSGASGGRVHVQKYRLDRGTKTATMLSATRIDSFEPALGTEPGALAGN